MAQLDALDLKAEVDGVEFAYDPQPDSGIKVRLARMRNPAMVAWQRGPEGQERLRELKTQMTADKATDRWFREAVAEFVVRGWSGLDQPYSIEQSVEFMTDPRRYPWQDWVASKSDTINYFLEADRADAEKNSGTA